MSETLHLFHHIHHEGDSHSVHHCGGEHVKVDPKLDYTVTHCPCGKHSIDKEEAVGHATSGDLESLEIVVMFTEKCPEGGWHVESGKVKSE